MEGDFILALVKNGGIVGGLTIVYFIIKLVMESKGKRNGVTLGLPDYQDGVKRAMVKVEELHKWHQPDEKGVQEWKNPNLAEAINKLTNAIGSATKQNALMTAEHTEAHREIVVLLKLMNGNKVK